MKKITTTTRRGKRCFRWYVQARARYRVIDPKQDEDTQRMQLAIELANGGKKKTTTQTLEQHLEDWYQDLLTVAKPKQALGTKKRAERVLGEARITDIHQITIARVRTAVDRLRCSIRNPQKQLEDYAMLSERSRHHHRRAIKQFTRWLTTEACLDSDPLQAWKLRTVVDERNPRDRLQPVELQTLISTAWESLTIVEGYDGVTRSWLYTLAALTGLRRGELASLRPESFDLTHRVVTVAASYTKDKKPARQPLPSSVIPELRAWMSGKSGQLFERLEIKRTQKMMVRDLRAAGIPYNSGSGNRCFHSLRNTYISSVVDAGASVAQAQRLARHSDVRLTMKYAMPRSDEWDLVELLPSPLPSPREV